MSEINYQALRDVAEKATWGDWDSYKPHRGARGYEVRLSSQAIAQHVLKNNAEFIAAFNPKIALALLDERERNQQYIKRRDQENEDIALTVGKLRVELEAAKSKLNEQREYYEGVIADGSKRIAELEKSEEQLINERDHAESALADMYFAATGNRPEWSNWFGFSDAVDAVVDRIADLEAKQPSPVVPEEMYWQDAPVEGSIKAAAYATGWNACRAAMLQGGQPVNQTYNLPELIEGMEVSIDVSTCDADLGNRYFGTVTEALELDTAKNGYILLVQDAEPNFDVNSNSPVTPDGWISCSERMPSEEDVLVYCSDTKEQMVGFHKGKGLFQFFYMNGVEGVCEPSHWMTLPEPPL
ncbi:ead/Ea22-like family protein [Escherichia coli]|nr:ead/Ea22-like family protein [Escherichia coli]